VTGTAEVLPAAPAEATVAYLTKYGEGIKGIGLTPEGMFAKYSAVIRITLKKVRGE